MKFRSSNPVMFSFPMAMVSTPTSKSKMMSPSKVTRHDESVAAAAAEIVIGAAPAVESVVAVVSEEHVVPIATTENILAVTAPQRIGARAAVHFVVAVFAEEAIISGSAA